jgi:hypothetical protein
VVMRAVASFAESAVSLICYGDGYGYGNGF